MNFQTQHIHKHRQIRNRQLWLTEQQFFKSNLFKNVTLPTTLMSGILLQNI